MFTDHTIFFPLGSLSPEFVGLYLTRYTDPETGWSAAHWDDSEHTRRRQASLFDGSIEPSPHYDATEPADLSPEERDAWRAAHLDGHTVILGWPEAFLTDIARDPQPEPELFSGIAIINH